MVLGSASSQASGQGSAQLADLLLAFGLSSLIGAEREFRQRSAGLRIYTLVGFGAALFMLISKYGFGDILEPRTVVLDRRRPDLRPPPMVWLTAAIGMACGAGLPRLAVAGTAGYLFVVLTYTPLVQRLPRAQSALAHLRLDYVDGRGVLREALMVCSAHGFTVGDLAVVRGDDVDESRGRDQRRDRSEATATRPATVQVTMTVQGGGEVPTLVSALTDVDGIVAVSAGDLDDD